MTSFKLSMRLFLASTRSLRNANDGISVRPSVRPVLKNKTTYWSQVLDLIHQIKQFAESYNIAFFKSLFARWWNTWGTMMACLCLPVDVFIFYKVHKLVLSDSESSPTIKKSWIIKRGVQCLGTPGHFRHFNFLGVGLYSLLHYDIWCSFSWQRSNCEDKR